MNTRLMNQIEAAAGRKDKEALLRQIDPVTRRWIRLAVDTYVTFGVTIDEAGFMASLATKDQSDNVLFGTSHAGRRRARCRGATWWAIGEELLGKLARRELTGNRGVELLNQWLRDNDGDPDAVRWALRVINKDLRCGVSQGIVMKALPGLIQPFAVQLAPHDAFTPEMLEGGPGYVEPKFDGVRVIIRGGVAYTRNGHVLTTIDHVIGELGKLGHEYVWDGEILDVAAGFDASSGLVRRKAGQSGTLKFYTWDVIPIDEWDRRRTSELMERKADLRALAPRLAQRFVQPVYGHWIEQPTYDDLIAYRERYVAEGAEGAMWKPSGRTYEFKRSDAIVKIKPFETADVAVVGYEPHSKEPDMLGAFWVEHDGERYKVGGGFTHAQRRELWIVRDVLVQRRAIIEVKFDKKTERGAARFPVFVRMRPDKEG